MRTLRPALTAAALGLLLVAAGCGKDLPNLAPNVAQAEKALAEALELEKGNTMEDARRRFELARQQAEVVLPYLVPGDERLPRMQKVRNEAAAGVARIVEKVRQREIRAVTETAPSGAGRAEAANLLPPVLAYKPPEVAPTPHPKNPPADPKNPPADPKDPGTTPKDPVQPPKDPEKPKDPEPPKEPEKPKDVHVGKVLLKGNKAVVIYWRFTNLSDGAVRIGAPKGYLLNKSGGQLTTFRQHFLAKDFQLNADDPLASGGTPVTPDSIQLGKGESRDLVTVGTTTQGAQAGGNELKDSLEQVAQE
jgi:hypothetical protein